MVSRKLFSVLLHAQDVDICGSMTCLVDYYSVGWASYYFTGSAWLIPVVTIGYFVVIIADNLLVWHSNKTISQMTAAQRGHKRDSSAGSGEDGDGSIRAMSEPRGDHHV